MRQARSTRGVDEGFISITRGYRFDFALTVDAV